MAGKKYQSCLVPFENEILTLRRRVPPVSFPKIAEYLKENHKISVKRQTIETFLKIRARGFKPCRYAEAIKPAGTTNQPTTEIPSLPQQTPPPVVSVVSNESQPSMGTQVTTTEVQKESNFGVKEEKVKKDGREYILQVGGFYKMSDVVCKAIKYDYDNTCVRLREVGKEHTYTAPIKYFFERYEYIGDKPNI